MKITDRIREAFFGRKKQRLDGNIFNNDCIVGVVKDKCQLDINLEHRFYHVPAKLVYELDLPIKYVALYASVKTFGRESAGILYYGEIISMKAAPRYTISEIPKNSDEIYFVFNVREWIKLEKPVKPLEVIGVVTMTSLALVKKSEYTAEIYMKNSEEYYLFQFLKQICINGADRKKYNFNGTKIAAAGKTIEVIFSNGERRKLNRAEYENKPFKLFRSIAIRHRN